LDAAMFEGAAEDTEFVVECEELGDPSTPLRQGDVLEWLGDHTDPWRRFAIVVTADCDLAHQKHAGLLACVPVLAHEDYLALFPLPARLAKAKAKLLERAVALIRGYQEANRPDFPVAMSDDAIAGWIDAVEADEIAEQLRVTEEKTARQLVDVVTAIKTCSRAASTGGLDPQLDALTTAWLVTQGKSTFEERRPALARELLDHLGRLPGDAIFLHGLSPYLRTGYVAYLRAIVNVDEGTVARRVPDLRDASAAAKRIARLTSPYVFHLSQALGQVFSAIGLPSRYETSRDAFIAHRMAHYGGTS
jgi:hypothetical protein